MIGRGRHSSITAEKTEPAPRDGLADPLEAADVIVEVLGVALVVVVPVGGIGPLHATPPSIPTWWMAASSS